MYTLQVLLSIFSLIALFLFAISKFSNQVRRLAGNRFHTLLIKITNTPLKGTLAGIFVTSIIQSSTATTVILVSLADAGLITFRNSLGVILGANIGTTFTSQLIALQVLDLAPILVIGGFLLDKLNNHRWHKYGRPVFYLGLVFFSLHLISLLILPLANDPQIINLIALTSNLGIAILVGTFITAIVQSSSIISGLVVIMVDQNLLTFNQALGILLGANIGTTVTALIASWVMGKTARRVALAHALFNIISVFLLLPIFGLFAKLVGGFGGSTALQVANAHLIFNILGAVVFIFFIGPFARLIEKIIK